jgi:hypothetical protein
MSGQAQRRVWSLILMSVPGNGVFLARAGRNLQPAIAVRGFESEGRSGVCLAAFRTATAHRKDLCNSLSTNSLFPATKGSTSRSMRIRGRIGRGVTAPSSSRPLHSAWPALSRFPRREWGEDLTDLRPQPGKWDVLASAHVEPVVAIRRVSRADRRTPPGLWTAHRATLLP